LARHELRSRRSSIRESRAWSSRVSSVLVFNSSSCSVKSWSALARWNEDWRCPVPPHRAGNGDRRTMRRLPSCADRARITHHQPPSPGGRSAKLRSVGGTDRRAAFAPTDGPRTRSRRRPRAHDHRQLRAFTIVGMRVRSARRWGGSGLLVLAWPTGSDPGGWIHRPFRAFRRWRQSRRAMMARAIP
jgi:hypothetical protein